MKHLLSVVYGAVKWCIDCRAQTVHNRAEGSAWWVCVVCGQYAEDQG